MSRNRIQHFWKYLHVKTKLLFNTLSITFNNFVYFLGQGKDSIYKYQFQCSLDSLAEKAAKSSRVICQSPTSWWNVCLKIWKMFSIGFTSEILAGIVDFRASISSQTDPTITLFCERSPSWRKRLPFVWALFKILGKCLQTNEKNFQLFLYHRNSPLQLHSFSMPLMLYYSKIPCCSFVTSFLQ